MLEVQLWRGGRAVEGTGLENRQRRKSLVGSNPTPSATESSTFGGGLWRPEHSLVLGRKNTQTEGDADKIHRLSIAVWCRAAED